MPTAFDYPKTIYRQQFKKIYPRDIHPKRFYIDVCFRYMFLTGILPFAFSLVTIKGIIKEVYRFVPIVTAYL